MAEPGTRHTGAGRLGTLGTLAAALIIGLGWPSPAHLDDHPRPTVDARQGGSALMTIRPLHPAHILDPVIAPIEPRPGQVLRADDPRAYIAANLVANADFRRVVLRVDGRAVVPEILGRDESDESLFYQPRRWVVGPHSASVTVTDVAGLTAHRSWSFRIVAHGTR